MKNLLLKSLLFFMLLSWIACEQKNIIRFSSPQPAGVEPESLFSKKIQGKYVNYDNLQDTLIVEQILIRSIKTIIFSCTRDELAQDSTMKIHMKNNEDLTEYLNQQGGKTIIKGDSVFYTETFPDTLFIINDENILKKFHNHYYLNYKYDDKSWVVEKLILKKDSLFIGEVFPNDTIIQYSYTSKEQVKVESDSGTIDSSWDAYILNPGKREFKHLSKSNAFKITSKYVKINQTKNK